MIERDAVSLGGHPDRIRYAFFFPVASDGTFSPGADNGGSMGINPCGRLLS
jgi:hypothetical protein